MGIFKSIKQFIKDISRPEPKMLWLRDDIHLSEFLELYNQNKGIIGSIKMYDRNDKEPESITEEGLEPFVGDYVTMLEIVPKENLTSKEDRQYDAFLAKLSDMGVMVCGGIYDQETDMSAHATEDFYISEDGEKAYIDFRKDGTIYFK